MSNEVPQERPILKTISLAITTDGLQEVSIEDGADTAAIFAKGIDWMNEQTAHQLQSTLVEEAGQRDLKKEKKEKQEKSRFVSQKIPWQEEIS